MNEQELIKYYNKFNEDKRLLSRHGIVEFTTTMKYIDKYLDKMNHPKIIDIGAGTGRYSLELVNDGYDVTAVELVKHNLREIEKKSCKIKAYQGNALNLKQFPDRTFDLTLLFGPLYHLINFNDKVKALNEAKRITKDNGVIMVVYCMNDFAILKHGFMDGNIVQAIKNGLLDENFKINEKTEDLYSRVRIEEIDLLNKKCNLKRIEMIAQDGPTDYIRHIINKMDEEEFKLYIKYHLSTCERLDMIGSSAHILDIVKK